MEKDVVSMAITLLTQQLSDTIADAVSKSLTEAIISKQFVIPSAGPDGKLVYTPEQVAELMGLSVDSVYNNLLRTSGFPRFKVGKKFIIPAQAFLQWLNSQEAA